MSTALYRRYRSARFGDLIGQPHLVATLLNEVRSGRVPHAYLFAGIRGTGKTSTARILARALNCLAPEDGEPCNRCGACTEILAGAAVDVLEIDAASNRGIDDVRELRERVNYLPASLRRKVYIIDEAHMLTTDAWNAFLKTLEEPPAHVLFILATTEAHRVPDTVRSRMQRFDFRRVSPGEIAAHLEDIARRESVEVAPDAARLLARAGQGSVRDSLSLLDQALAGGERPLTIDTVRRALGLADPAVVRDLVAALGRGDGAAALRSAGGAFEAGADAQQLLREVSRLARAAAFGGLGFAEGADVDAADAELCRDLAAAAPPRFWVGALELMGAAEMNLRQPVDARLQVELCLLRLLHPEPSQPGADPGLEQRVAALEAAAGPASAAALLPAASRASRPTAPPAPVPAAPATPVAPPAAAEAAATGSAPEPVSADPGPEPGAPVDLASWRSSWPRLLAEVDRRDFMLAGLLNGCRPEAAAEGRLVVGALHRFHYEQVSAAPKLLVLSEVAGGIAGRPVSVETVFVGEELPRPAGPSADTVARRALEAFPGSRLVGSRPRKAGAGSDAEPEDGAATPDGGP